MRVSRHQTLIVCKVRRENLADDIAVGDSDDETVFRGRVFVLVLRDQTLASVVIGLVLATPAELDLVALVVRLVLHNLHENLLYNGGEFSGICRGRSMDTMLTTTDVDSNVTPSLTVLPLLVSAFALCEVRQSVRGRQYMEGALISI